MGSKPSFAFVTDCHRKTGRHHRRVRVSPSEAERAQKQVSTPSKPSSAQLLMLPHYRAGTARPDVMRSGTRKTNLACNICLFCGKQALRGIRTHLEAAAALGKVRVPVDPAQAVHVNRKPEHK